MTSTNVKNCVAWLDDEKTLKINVLDNETPLEFEVIKRCNDDDFPRERWTELLNLLLTNAVSGGCGCNITYTEVGNPITVELTNNCCGKFELDCRLTNISFVETASRCFPHRCQPGDPCH